MRLKSHLLINSAAFSHQCNAHGLLYTEIIPASPRLAGMMAGSVQRRYDMNGKTQMQEGKNWIFPKEINANRFFRDSHWQEI
jgi:hypothetical protein